MSGPGQHFIPQLLQRGFLAPELKGERVWVFPKDGPIRPQRITEVGKQRHFNSPPSVDGKPTVDEAITALESDLAGKVARLRQQALDEPVNAQVAAELVAHFTVRTAHLRDSLGEGMREIAAVSYGVFDSEANVRRLVGLDAAHMNDRFAEKLLPALEEEPKFKQLGIPLPAIARMAFILGRENFTSGFMDAFRPQVTTKLGLMYGLAGQIARDSHTKALASIAEPSQRTTALAQFTWRLVGTTEPAILPDCVAIAVDRAGNWQPLFGVDAEELVTLYMPVSATRLLVGDKPNSPAPKSYLFNIYAAACSRKFFISSANTPEIAQLHTILGVQADAMISAAIQEGATTFLPAAPSANSPDTGAGTEAAREGDVEPALPEGGYQVSFLGLGDEALGQSIADVVGAIVQAVGETVPLTRLDGITFAEDYPQALRDLDRGISNARPLTTIDSERGFGVGMAPVIVKDGQIKVRVIVRAWFAHALIGDDETQRQQAVHVIAYLLGLVSNTTLLERALPGIVLSSLPNAFESRLYEASNEAYSSYHAARVSAPFRYSALDEYHTRLTSALEAVRSVIPQARMDFRFHGDAGNLISTVLPLVADLLDSAAQLIGHVDGEGEETPNPGATLFDGFEEAGLGKWFVLFHNDLRNLWDRRGRWVSFQEQLALNHHVERILMLFGILPWETDSGRMYVTVPLGTDSANLGRESVRRLGFAMRRAALFPRRTAARLWQRWRSFRAPAGRPTPEISGPC